MLHRWSWQEESRDTFFAQDVKGDQGEIIHQGPGPFGSGHPHTQGKAGWRRKQRALAERKLCELLSLCLGLLICEQEQ